MSELLNGLLAVLIVFGFWYGIYKLVVWLRTKSRGHSQVNETEPKTSNVYKWMIGGALIGLLTAIPKIKGTWGPEDIGSIIGGPLTGVLFGGLIAMIRNRYVPK
jgi:hypothetical protein